MIVRGVDGTESSNVEEIQVDEWMQTVEACAIEFSRKSKSAVKMQ